MIELKQTLERFMSAHVESEQVSVFDASYDLQAQLNNACFDSREIQTGDVLIVLPSVAGNEQQYVDKAISQGCALVVAQKALQTAQVPLLQLKDVMAWAGGFLNAYYAHQQKNLNVIGITGTNGKSSISFYLAQLLNALKNSNETCAVMGTLGFGPWDNLQSTGMTTLPLEKLHKALAQLRESFDHVAIEVSSHGLEQKRLSGVNFSLAVFSNLSRDHLDYHGTMEAYGAEKAKLFQWHNLQGRVINIDDEFGAKLAQTESPAQLIAYGQSANADLRFEITSVSNTGLQVLFVYGSKQASVNVPLYGEFNAYNAAAALACALYMGFDFKAAVAALKVLTPVEGRMMQVQVDSAGPLVLVDYAHTPDALEQVLKSVKNHCEGRIHLVVGCGGDRDQGKRPLMAKIAMQSADKVMFTSDNPRTESPERILQDMTANLEGDFGQELDRKIAIEQTIAQADEHDLVIVAGKGHEDYQEINGQRFVFSDKAVALAALQQKVHMEKTV